MAARRQKKKVSKVPYYVISGLVLIIVGALWYASRSSESPVSNGAEALPGLQVSPAPWPPDIARLRERLTLLGLPALTREGSALHLHQHLDIFVNGSSVGVPASIGVNGIEGFISPIHTHDGSGIIHIESPTVQPYTLGQFFDIWGVRLTRDCIGGYCAQEGTPLNVFSNGRPVAGDPRELKLEPHQEIAIIYGPSPQEIPSSFQFPPGS